MPIARAGDVSLEYYVEGDGPPLLMIMGFAGQAGSWGERFLQHLRPQFQLIRFDALDRLAQIEAPTLVVHGDADLLVPPANGIALHRAITGSQWRVIERTGHMFFWDKPRESAEAIAGFLSTLPVAA